MAVTGTFDDGRTIGTACTDSAGTHVSFVLHTMIPNGTVLDDFVDLALPAVAGTYSGTDSYRSNYGPLAGPVSESRTGRVPRDKKPAALEIFARELTAPAVVATLIVSGTCTS